MKESGKEFISELDKSKDLNKYLWKFIILEAIIIILLAVSFFSLRETVRVNVEIPSKIISSHHPVVLAGIKGANKVYYELWVKYLTEEISNFNPENINSNFQILIKAFYPRDYAKEEKKILKLVSLVKENLISQKFNISKIEIKKLKKENDLISEGIFKAYGVATQKEGKKAEISKECSYLYKMKYIRGVLYVENFTTDCF